MAELPSATAFAPSADSASDYERAVCAHAEYYTALYTDKAPMLQGNRDALEPTTTTRALLRIERDNIYEAAQTARGSDPALRWAPPANADIQQSLDKFRRPAASRQLEAELAGAAGTEYNIAIAAHAEYYSALLGHESPRLSGSGQTDEGRAQVAAVRTLRVEHENILKGLDTALGTSALGWLLPFARHLSRYLKVSSGFLQMRESYSLLLEVAKRLGNEELELAALLGAGLARMRLGDFAEARTAIESAHILATGLDDRQSEAVALNSLGMHEHSRGNYNAAEDLYNQSLAVYRFLDDLPGEAASQSNLGLVSQIQGNFAAARESFCQALAIWRRIGDRWGEAQSMNSLSFLESNQGNFSAAREWINQALAIQRSIRDRWGEAQSLNDLGIVEYNQSNSNAAVELYKQALAIRRTLGDRWGQGGSLNNLGEIEHSQGNYSTARDLYNQALAVWRSIGDLACESHTLANLSNVEYSQGEYSAAAKLCSQALAIQRRLGEVTGIAMICARGGAGLAGLGQHREATVALHAALARVAELGYQIEPNDQQVINSGVAQLTQAVESSEISAEELAQWKAEGEAMGLDELAEFTLATLEKAGTSGTIATGR